MGRISQQNNLGTIKTFKELKDGDRVFFVDPSDKKIKDFKVKEVIGYHEKGYVNVICYKVAEDIANKVYDSNEQIPTQTLMRIRENDTSFIGLLKGLPIAMFTSKSALKRWLTESNTKIVQTKKP